MCRKIVVLIIRFQEKLIQNLHGTSIPLAILMKQPHLNFLYSTMRTIFFSYVCVSSKKSPPISRVNKHQCNNNKKVRIEGSFLEIARGEGLRAVHLSLGSLHSSEIEPMLDPSTQLRYAESGERLQKRGSLVHLAT